MRYTRKLTGSLASIHRLVLFFSDVYRFFHLPVHFVDFSADDLGLIPSFPAVFPPVITPPPGPTPTPSQSPIFYRQISAECVSRPESGAQLAEKSDERSEAVSGSAESGEMAERERSSERRS